MSVIFEGDRVLLGQDSSVDIMNYNGSEKRYTAPDLQEHPIGDEIDADVKTEVINPPDPKSPPNPIKEEMRNIIESLREFFKEIIPAEEEPQNQIASPKG
jgi:hypothetical protein